MTEEEELEATWDPWITLLTVPLNLSDGDGGHASSTFSAYAESFGDAKKVTMLHCGIVLREHGLRPAWLKER